MTSSNRRAFLGKSLALVSSLPLLHAIGTPSTAAAQSAPTVPLDPANPQALALGYVHDATKTDTTKFPKRAQPGGEKQFCNGCVLYLQGGLKADGQDGEWGKCALFQAGLVNAKGWCNSFAPKPV